MREGTEPLPYTHKQVSSVGESLRALPLVFDISYPPARPGFRCAEKEEIMNAKEFVELFYTEKNNMLKMYFSNPKDTEVGLKIGNLGLTTEQMEKMQSIVDTVLTDAM